MKEQDCAIVIMSCDAYSDLWNDFFLSMNKYWSDCNLHTYIVTNNKECEISNVTTIKCGDDLNWTGRLLKCLNAIRENKIILMLEDYYISDYVDNDSVNKIIDYVDMNSVSYYKLETRGTCFGKIHDGIDYLREITPDIRYGVSLITSLWDKRFLLDVINGEDYPAWEFEIRRNLDNDITKTTSKLMLCDERNVLHIMHMVQRGKYLKSAVRKMNKKGVVIDSSIRGENGLLFDFYLNIVCALKQNTRLRSTVLKFMHLFKFKSVSEKYAEEMKTGTYR